MAYCAEEFFGVADIPGAYAAGLAVADPALDEKIRAARAKMQAGVEEAAAEIEAKYGC